MLLIRGGEAAVGVTPAVDTHCPTPAQLRPTPNIERRTLNFK